MQATDSGAKLERSLKEKEVLTGKVEDVVFGAEDTGQAFPVGSDYFVISWQNDVEIHVPLHRFSSTDLAQKNRRQGEKKGTEIPLATTLRRYLLNRKGSEFDFVVTHIPYDSDGRINGPVIGDRLIAMEQMRRSFWLKKDNAGDYAVQPGAVFEARIVDVAPESIRVELKGIERILYKEELLLEDSIKAFERYHVGTNILVEIVKITLRDEKSCTVKAQLRKAMEESGT